MTRTTRCLAIPARLVILHSQKGQRSLVRWFYLLSPWKKFNSVAIQTKLFWQYFHVVLFFFPVERFSHDLEMKTREQNRNNKRTEIRRYDWFIERTQKRVAFGCLENARVKKLHAWELSRNQPILCFDVIQQHDWLIKRCLLHIRVFFGGKTKRPCFDLLIHWLIKQTTNTYQNHFPRSYENRSILQNGIAKFCRI